MLIFLKGLLVHARMALKATEWSVKVLGTCVLLALQNGMEQREIDRLCIAMENVNYENQFFEFWFLGNSDDDRRSK